MAWYASPYLSFGPDSSQRQDIVQSGASGFAANSVELVKVRREEKEGDRIESAMRACRLWTVDYREISRCGYTEGGSQGEEIVNVSDAVVDDRYAANDEEELVRMEYKKWLRVCWVAITGHRQKEAQALGRGEAERKQKWQSGSLAERPRHSDTKNEGVVRHALTPSERPLGGVG